LIFIWYYHNNACIFEFVIQYKMVRDIVFTVVAFLSIGSGLWAILLVNRLNNVFRLNYLNTYLYYQILLFAFGLYGLLGMALIDELLTKMEAPVAMVETIMIFLPYLGIPFLITAWYMFIKLSMEMVNKKIKGSSTIIYFILLMLLILGYGFLIFYYYGVQSEEAKKLSGYIKLLFIVVEVITFLIAFSYLYIIGVRIKKATSRKMILNFAHINLVLKTLAVILFFFSERDSYIGAVYILVFFSGDLPAILYLGYYLNKHFLTSSGDTEPYKPYSRFISDYSISKREWEIVEKICEGLTNKQISEVLFISLQTVKDHTHHIYKKTGMKNRVQLVNMISELKNRNTNKVI